MKVIVRLRLRGCEMEFVEHLGPGIVAMGEVVIDPLASIEDCMEKAKACMLDQLFELEYLVEDENDSKSLDYQRFDGGPAIIYVQ